MAVRWLGPTLPFFQTIFVFIFLFVTWLHYLLYEQVPTEANIISVVFYFIFCDSFYVSFVKKINFFCEIQDPATKQLSLVCDFQLIDVCLLHHVCVCVSKYMQQKDLSFVGTPVLH